MHLSRTPLGTDAAAATRTRPYALDARRTEDAVRELADRAEITDALYRFGLGQDLHDRALFRSAFADDATLDFGPAAAAWGGHSPVMTGADTIVDTILTGFDGRVGTSHTVSNPRVAVAADRGSAELTALVEAQHLLTADRTTYALLKNLYAVALVPAGDGSGFGSAGDDGSGSGGGNAAGGGAGRWLIRTLRIDNIWYSGDPGAVFG
ncbi:nuclear transport factor 2 family protein [Streptomyces sp. NBC_00669]|uniref:nuclear transport factor 2 family protein n=1 Tax=Streptomyces sp. NBC_00669 TaxID=2976011 RepID=UPI002E3599FC|nr:nuclear transport factor 2 family protein [Streptomyces sp. NBC_00669]